MLSFLHDLRFALRQLRRAPAFALIAILTLALGIGVNTAIFSVVNGLLFSSLHVRDQSRLTILAFQQKGNSWQSTLSLPEYHELRDQEKNVFSDLAADQFGLDGLSMQGSKPDRAFTDYVSGNYFQMQGVQPLLGRFFRPSEGETPGADPVMVLSYAYWQQHFAGDPHIIGRQVSLDGHPLTIIGVAPGNYHGLVPVLAVQAYLPLAMIVPIENAPLADWSERIHRNMHLYGRLQSGVTPQQANAALAVLARHFATEHPRTEKDTELRTFPLYMGRTGQLDTENTIGMASALFLGLAGLVLLLACMNVANLLLVRASVREREMVIRSALGAQRSRLIRQMLTESILLALLGGAAGIVLGLWGSFFLSSVNMHVDMPIYFNFGFDWHVFAFSAGVAFLAGAIVGMVPAMRLSRANLNFILREGGRGVTGGSSKFRDALVMLQVGSALMLLIIAGLFTRSLAQAEHTSLGFNPSHVLTLSMDPSEIGYSDSQIRDFYKTLLGRIRTLPGVEAATIAESTPMSMIDNGSDTVAINGYQPPPGQPAPSVGYNVIATDYFRTLQIPLVQGRGFTENDNEKNLYVAIVSESMVKKFWPNQYPIGKQFTMDGDPTHPLQVVGIVKDARYQGVTGAIPPYFYVPYMQHYAQNPLESLELRTAGDPTAMIPEIERTIHTMTPTLPVFEVKTLQQGLYTVVGLLDFQVAAVLAAVMGTLGLILAVIGVYGVLSYVVSQKTNEIGIRMALGAQHADILKMIYRQGLWIVGIGLTVGLAATFAAAHLMRSFIVVSATDPLTYIGVSAILVAIALLACYIPARRAMHVEPMEALRTE
ncbi:MAG TPA: ABC transporter permease [Acidobacteriaceae bacterium]|jgi:predicted permease|nr:ABC transporter permease [Acidobacteriaceae bacterium]